ncbi:MAG: cupin domain-containing protein [Chloroflexota bacterium]|nr:cupin domain-containing protein [Chloroflexota bacterium]
MANVGDVITNPVTGEQLTFLKTAQMTNGELLQFDLTVRPHGFVLTEHTHPHQEERFKLLAGALQMRVNGREQVVRTGQEVAVPPGVPHAWWNAGDEAAHLIVEFRPALNAETLFETLFGLARDGKTDKQARPNPWQFAVIVQAFSKEAQPARLMDKLLLGTLLPILATIGRLLGYRAVYPAYTSVAQPAGAQAADLDQLTVTNAQ